MQPPARVRGESGEITRTRDSSMLRSGERLMCSRRKSSVSRCSGTSLVRPPGDRGRVSSSSPPEPAKPTPIPLLLLLFTLLLTLPLLLRVAGALVRTVVEVEPLLLPATGAEPSSSRRRSRKVTDRTRFKSMMARQASASAWKVLGAYLS